MNTVKPGWTKADWFNVILGIWVAISPLALGFVRRSAIWNNIVLGVIILMVALLSGWRNGAIAGLLVVLGVWLFTSPFVLGYWKPAFLWNNVVTPFVLITSAAISDELRVIQFLPKPSRSNR
jgi:predicted anti-sigma-YlaC factor YlaD